MSAARRVLRTLLFCLLATLCAASTTSAQSARLTGVVTDETGGALPGVEVRLRRADAEPDARVTDAEGRFRFEPVASGTVEVTFSMLNFGSVRRDLEVPAAGTVEANIVLHYVLSADVTVAGRRSFVNLADAANPAENLVGIAQSASQGAITAAQLDTRPMSRAGEVLEAVPGLIVSQHSGQGKANQYYLRGFNLDHGTDFATTVAGVPANMPTHAHGHGYTDLNFLIPELITGVQYSKGPYFAEQGDFATAGAATINYATEMDGPTMRVTGGGGGYRRLFGAGSLARAGGTTLGAVELETNDGPWTLPDDFRKINAVGRYSRGGSLNGFSAAVMAYDAKWNATDQIPGRAVASGLVGRFGNVDASDGGSTSRYSASAEWQRSTARALTRVAAFGLAYRLSLFSNFTYFLDDPVNGDQFRQADRRVAAGGRITHRRVGAWRDRPVQSVFGVQLRTDRASLQLDRTVSRALLEPVRGDRVRQSSVAGFAEHSVEWRTWLRSTLGLRADGYHFSVDAVSEPVNGGTASAGILSPKAGLVVGPFGGTEFYGNAGSGFHSNDARGSTITVDPVTGRPVQRVTPLARAVGAEAGVRTVAVPHLQSSLSLWTLGLASELVFIGDAGTTEAGRPSRRSGVEFANYLRPLPWLVVDADVSWSHARFRDGDTAGVYIPGSVETVVSGGVTVENLRRVFASARLRYFGARPLLEDNSIRSSPTRLVNVELGYRWSTSLRLSLDGFNLLNATVSDIDYVYTSRLPGEPAGGIEDRHFHPALPRTFRLTLTAGL